MLSSFTRVFKKLCLPLERNKTSTCGIISIFFTHLKRIDREAYNIIHKRRRKKQNSKMQHVVDLNIKRINQKEIDNRVLHFIINKTRPLLTLESLSLLNLFHLVNLDFKA